MINDDEMSKGNQIKGKTGIEKAYETKWNEKRTV